MQIVSDDRARVWLNGQLFIDEWSEHPATPSSAVVQFDADQRYLLRVEFFENRGEAKARLLWSSPDLPKEVIPQSQLYSEVADRDGDQMPDVWEASHGLNPDLPADAEGDLNNDKITNLEHYRIR